MFIVCNGNVNEPVQPTRSIVSIATANIVIYNLTGIDKSSGSRLATYIGYCCMVRNIGRRGQSERQL